MKHHTNLNANNEEQKNKEFRRRSKKKKKGKDIIKVGSKEIGATHTATFAHNPSNDNE